MILGRALHSGPQYQYAAHPEHFPSLRLLLGSARQKSHRMPFCDGRRARDRGAKTAMTSPRSSGRVADALLRALGSSTSCMGLGLEDASSVGVLLMAVSKRIAILRRASFVTKMVLQVPLEAKVNPDQAVQEQGMPAIAAVKGANQLRVSASALMYPTLHPLQSICDAK